MICTFWILNSVTCALEENDSCLIDTKDFQDQSNPLNDTEFLQQPLFLEIPVQNFNEAAILSINNEETNPSLAYNFKQNYYFMIKNELKKKINMENLKTNKNLFFENFYLLAQNKSLENTIELESILRNVKNTFCRYFAFILNLKYQNGKIDKEKILKFFAYIENIKYSLIENDIKKFELTFLNFFSEIEKFV